MPSGNPGVHKARRCRDTGCGSGHLVSPTAASLVLTEVLISRLWRGFVTPGVRVVAQPRRSRGRTCNEFRDSEPLLRREPGPLASEEREEGVCLRRLRPMCAGFCAAHHANLDHARGIRGLFESCVAHWSIESGFLRHSRPAPLGRAFGMRPVANGSIRMPPPMLARHCVT